MRNSPARLEGSKGQTRQWELCRNMRRGLFNPLRSNPLALITRVLGKTVNARCPPRVSRTCTQSFVGIHWPTLFPRAFETNFSEFKREK